MARDWIQTLHRTMGAHVLMFVSHEAGEGQVKMAVFKTAPEDGKKPFTASSEASKDWILNGETILTDYLLTAPVEEDSAEKQEVEISLDEDGNPELPTWGGQKLKVQQNLARAVFQAAYAKFTKKPKAKFPWGLLIKSPTEYLDSESIPEGFTMKDPSKWTKADLGLLWDHWQSLEAEKVIVSFTDCKKEDAPLSRQFDRKVVGSSKKRVWVTVEDDSEAEVGGTGVPGPSVTRPSVVGTSGQTMDTGEVPGEATTDVGEQTPEEYQVLLDLVDALPEEESAKWTEEDFPCWETWTWSAKYLPEEIHLDLGAFQKAIVELQSARFSSSSRGLEVVLGLGLLLRECSHAQEVEEDDPVVSNLHFLVNSKLVSRLEQCSTGTKEPQGGNGGEGLGGSNEGDEEKEEEEAPPQQRKRAGSGIVTRGQKMVKKDEEKGKKQLGGNGRKGISEFQRLTQLEDKYLFKEAKRRMRVNWLPTAIDAYPTFKGMEQPPAMSANPMFGQMGHPTFLGGGMGHPPATSASPTFRGVGQPLATSTSSTFTRVEHPPAMPADPTFRRMGDAQAM
ncbi:hypothetical protein EDD16DRAFT_1521753 [Pisolithus croceorrhizus]|nr:hypothetical protein EDD16DRAFT_1521753 [Pisolithus croceorrhizus]